MLGSQIKEHRKRKGWSVRHLADSSGISASYLYDIERGRTTPSLVTLRTLANRLHLRTGDLIIFDPITEEDEWNLLKHYREGNWRAVLNIVVDKIEGSKT